MSPAMRVAAKVTRAMVTGLAVRRRRHQGPVRGTHARIREAVPGVLADPASCPFPGPVGDAPSRADAERAVGPDGDCDRPGPD